MLDTKQAETDRSGPSITRRTLWATLSRFLIVAAFLAVLGLFVLMHSILPVLLRSGMLDAAIRDMLSGALKADVTFSSVDMERPGVVSVYDLKVSRFHEAVPEVQCPRVDAEFSMALIPFGRLHELTFTHPRIRTNLDMEQITHLLGGSEQGTPLRIKGPTDLPSIHIKGAFIRGTLARDPFEIRHVEAHLLNKGGFHLPFTITGYPKGVERDTVNASGYVQLTETSGQLVLSEFRSSIHDMNLEIKSDAATPIRGTLKIGTLQVAKSLRRILKYLIDFEIDALVSTDCSFEISADGVEKLKLQGRIGSYTFVGHRVDIRGGDKPLSLEVELSRRTGESGWSCEGTLSNVQTRLQQNAVFKIEQIGFRCRVSGSGSEFHPVGEIRFIKCSIADPMTETELLNVIARLTFDLFVDPESETGHGRVVFSVGQSEVLLKSGDTLDFSKTAIDLAFDGVVDLKRKRAHFTELSMSVADLGKFYLKGTAGMGPGGLEYDVFLTARSIPIPMLWSKFSAFAQAVPLRNVTGTLDMDVHMVNGMNLFKAGGHLQGRDIAADLGPYGIKKTSFNLPVHIYSGPATEEEVRPELGTITVGELALPGGSAENLTFLVLGRKNGYELKDAVSLPAFGGTVRIDGFEYADFISRPRVRIGASFLKLQLDKITALAGLDKPMAGELNGEIDIVPEKDDLVFKGSATADVFGGRMAFHDMRVRNFATDHHSLQLSADMEEISLEEICKTFVDFGALRGVLIGTVDDLEIYKTGELSGFEIYLRAVPRPGVKQKADIRGVKKMVLLAEGPDSELLSQLKWAPDAYYYEKLGVYMKLKNDRLLIRGAYYETSSLGRGVREHPLETLQRNGGIRKSRTEYIIYGVSDPIFGLISYKTFNVMKGRPGKWTRMDVFKTTLERMLKGE